MKSNLSLVFANILKRPSLKNCRPDYLVSVYTRYEEVCGDAEEEPFASPQTLGKNLLKRFKNQIEMQYGQSFRKVILLKGLSGDTICSAFDYNQSSEAAFCKAAVLLQDSFKAVQKTPYLIILL